MNKISKKIIFSGIFGNVLESYDFGVYAFFSPIIATVFFSGSDPLTALLLTFGIFALSFLVRHFGGVVFVILVAPIIAMILTTLAELFHVKTRNTGISLGYNIGQAIFGGTVPLIAVSLTASTHNLYAPAWYLMAGAFLSLFTLLTIKESYQKTLT